LTYHSPTSINVDAWLLCIIDVPTRQKYVYAATAYEYAVVVTLPVIPDVNVCSPV
jgi:hypothetical protein